MANPRISRSGRVVLVISVWELDGTFGWNIGLSLLVLRKVSIILHVLKNELK